MAGAGETVTVACKLPAGLILTVYDMVEGYENVMGGGTRKILTGVRRPDVAVKINGTGALLRGDPEMRPQVSGGFALTPNVPSDIWEAWLAANKDADCVKHNLIFASKTGAIYGMTKEHAKQRSGLEPLNTEKTFRNGREVPVDPRIPHSIEKGASA